MRKKNNKKCRTYDVLEELLKTMSYGEVAKHYGVSRQRVEQVAKARGLRSATIDRREEIVRRIQEDNGNTAPTALARRLDMSVTNVVRIQQKFGIKWQRPASYPPELLNRLGTQTDYALAREYNIKEPVIARLRRENGIPAMCVVGERVNTPKRFGPKPPDDIADRLIAAIKDGRCSVSAISRHAEVTASSAKKHLFKLAELGLVEGVPSRNGRSIDWSLAVPR